MDLCLSSDENEGASPPTGKDFVFTSDEEEEARPPREEAVAVPKLGHEGVTWHNDRGRWRGWYYDKLKRKQIRTSYFPKDQLAACIEAREALKAPREARFWAQVTAWKDADAKFEGVPLGPENPADAKNKTVYWRPNQHDGHKPYLAVRKSNGKKGFNWKAACQHRGCTNMAVNSKEGKAVHCLTHGGGCPHHMHWGQCRKCNDDAKKQAGNCSSCAAVGLRRGG